MHKNRKCTICGDSDKQLITQMIAESRFKKIIKVGTTGLENWTTGNSARDEPQQK